MMILSLMLQENREGNLTEKQREYAAAIHGAGGDLLRLINDVLDLSKVEAGHMEIHVEPLEIKEIVQYVERSFMPLSVRKGVELVIRTGEDLPEVINTDSQRLMQIIGNLMSNAFKFTSDGKVTFRLELSDGMWLFMIEDTGIGIPENQQEEIFQAFRQADGTISRNFGGTGLGLSISQKLARALGGNITVTSGIGQGSTFILWVPLIAPNASGSKNIFHPLDRIQAHEQSVADNRYLLDRAAPMEAAVSISGEEDNDSVTDSYLHKILIVDDDIRNVFALSVALEDAGLQVVFAENGVDALEMLAADHDAIDLVLMDIMMPRMDGYEAIREIRKIPELTDLPIIAVTAKAMKEDQQRCMDAGASDYLTKPIDINRLLSLLKVWLHKEE
jgi:two-component system chemotaxis sensor kinase CheA